MLRQFRRIVTAITGRGNSVSHLENNEDQTASTRRHARIKTAAEIAAERREANFVELINPCLDNIVFISVQMAPETLQRMLQEIKVFTTSEVAEDGSIVKFDAENNVQIFAELKDLFLNADSYVEATYAADDLSHEQPLPDPQQMQELRGLIIKRMQQHTKKLLELGQKQLADMINRQQQLQAEQTRQQTQMLQAANARKAKLAGSLTSAEQRQMQEYGIVEATQAPEARLCIALGGILRNIKSYQMRFKSYAAARGMDRVDFEDIESGMVAHLSRIRQDYKDIYVGALEQLHFSSKRVAEQRALEVGMDALPLLEWSIKVIIARFNGSLTTIAQLQPLSDQAKDCLLQYPNDFTEWVEARERGGVIRREPFPMDPRFEKINATAPAEFCLTAELLVRLHRIVLTLGWMRCALTAADATTIIEFELASFTTRERELLVVFTIGDGMDLIEKHMHVKPVVATYDPEKNDDPNFTSRLSTLTASTKEPLRYFKNAINIFGNHGLTLAMFQGFGSELRKALLEKPAPGIELVREMGMRGAELALHQYTFFEQVFSGKNKKLVKDLLQQCIKDSQQAQQRNLDPRKHEVAIDMNQLLRFPEKDLLDMLADPEKLIYGPAQLHKQSVNRFLSTKIKKLPAPRLTAG